VKLPAIPFSSDTSFVLLYRSKCSFFTTFTDILICSLATIWEITSQARTQCAVCSDFAQHLTTHLCELLVVCPCFGCIWDSHCPRSAWRILPSKLVWFQFRNNFRLTAFFQLPVDLRCVYCSCVFSLNRLWTFVFCPSPPPQGASTALVRLATLCFICVICFLIRIFILFHYVFVV
jgi:hypothetical protein